MVDACWGDASGAELAAVATVIVVIGRGARAGGPRPHAAPQGVLMGPLPKLHAACAAAPPGRGPAPDSLLAYLNAPRT